MLFIKQMQRQRKVKTAAAHNTLEKSSIHSQ
jgi:hypothetical protein